MNVTHKIKAAAATLTVGFLLAIAFAGAAQAGNGTSAQVMKALQARSDAWNRFYHLGAYSQSTAAVQRRSDAWNRYFQLGAYGRAAAAAEQRRSEATNRYYRLGRYAVVGETSRFVWSDAGIGAGAMLGLIMLAGGLTVVVRRRGAGNPSFPSTT